jgi:hypothetical protein
MRRKITKQFKQQSLLPTSIYDIYFNVFQLNIHLQGQHQYCWKILLGDGCEAEIRWIVNKYLMQKVHIFG